ncbi:MAG: hypothetical protein K2M74_04985, partial [Bacteroidales bacterium]|nr:hypothetical protein [Bacteroidales bacterium]
MSLSACEALNLATEKTLGSAVTSFELKDEAGNAVAASAYTETDFSFLFKDPFNGTLTLQNTSVPSASMTYHITAEECASEPPTPSTTKTDTLYFEFELTAGTSSATIEYRFLNTVLPGIEMEYNDGEAHPKFTPNATGSIVVHGSGHGWVYYTYEPGESYTAAFTSGAGILAGNSDIAVVSLVSNITSLDVSGCTALEELHCGFNQLTSLNVSGCTALKELRCQDNQLTSLDVSSDTALIYLDCNNNQLSALDVTHNSALVGFYCNNNRLTELDVSHNSQLRNLQCDNNQLSALDVSQNPVLRVLTCGGNRMITLDLSSNPYLKLLKCSENHIPLSTLYGIYSQWSDWDAFIADNQTDTITVAMCRALDLSSESPLSGVETAYELKYEAGNEVSAGAYTENGFVFQFNNPATYTLSLENSSVPSASMTYHITT